ncbi:MAG: hypothetical protein KF804_08905 [Burkholderiales bacterium]|nr:hypothetical protein [Burkholderiales bacterium]
MEIQTMRDYLSKSIASNRAKGVLNQNKLRGLLAEVDFRNHLARLGFANRISLGGWIARRTGPGEFGQSTVAIFPEVISDGSILSASRISPEPSRGLHTICATFHQIGIHGYYCVPDVRVVNDANGLSWQAVQLGTPNENPFMSLNEALSPYLRARSRQYNFLSYKTDVSTIPDPHVAEEFLKEHLRVSFQSSFMAEVSDIDGIFWGQQYTYPLEIKEKTSANDRSLGEFFGLDVGPFVKLAYYAAKRGNLHSMFVVREISDTETRELRQWWFITFDKLAQFASWNQQGGGTNMRGGGSTVVKIPKDQFLPMTREQLERL